MYFLGHSTKAGKTMVFRGLFFVLPIKAAPENADLKEVTTAESPDGLTGDYVDFLIEDSLTRYQTVRSLLFEVFGLKNVEKSTKKEGKKKSSEKK